MNIGLKDEFEKYIGFPFNRIPDPFGCCESDADHYITKAIEPLADFDIHMHVQRDDDLYRDSQTIALIRTVMDEIVVLNHPSGLHVGYQSTIHVHTPKVPVLSSEIIARIDPSTHEEIEKNPTHIWNGVAGYVRMRLEKIPLVIETQDTFPKLSQFAIRDLGRTIGAGKCLRIKEIREVRVK